MNFKRKLGAASVLAAAWYSAAAAAADYNTQIYSVTVDEQNGILKIDGVDLAPGSAPASAHVQLLGHALEIRDGDSSTTHLEATLPESVSLNPGTGYQLYVSPDRSRDATGPLPADQAYFTLYVASKVDGAKIAAIEALKRGGAVATNPASRNETKNFSNSLLNSLGSAFSLNTHSATTNVTGTPSPNDGATFTLPYTGSYSSPGALFSLTNTSTGDAIDGISNSTAANAVAIRGTISSTSPGASSAAVRGINNGTGTVGIGVYGSHAGSGWGVYGSAVSGSGIRGAATAGGIGLQGTSNSGFGLYADSNTGNAAVLTIGNSKSNGIDLWLNNNGLGRGLLVSNKNASSAANAMEITVAGTGGGAVITNGNNQNTADILYVTTNGPGVIADHSQGNAGNFFINNTNSVGAGVRGETNSIFGNNGTAGVYGSASGTGGYGGYFDHTNSSGFGMALYATTNGQGMVGQFVTPSSAGGSNGNSQPTVSIQQNLNGEALDIVTTSPTGSGTNPNTANVVHVVTNGPGVIADHTQGNAGSFVINNTTSVGAGVRGETNSIFGNNGTAGVYGSASGTGGYGGYFDHTNQSGFGMALYGTTNGQGMVAQFVTPYGAGGTGGNDNSQPTVQITQTANGKALDITSTSPTASGSNPNTNNIVNVVSDQPGVIPDQSQGVTANFVHNNTTAVNAAVRGETNSIFGNAGTAGIYGVASGTGGYAGYFDHTETSGFGITLQVVSHDQGSAMVVDHEGSAGDPVLVQVGGFNVARIDRNGKGFFNGGTQNSGADLAEFVPTIGTTPQVGDVVEIDPEHPNSFRLCAEANTTRVAGIISTAPGVTLNAKNGATADVSGPALALAGRVPTKVNNRGGAIHIGDLLVASSEPGRAMRAPAHPEPGTVIGKALQDSDAAEGSVEVLVMLR